MHRIILFVLSVFLISCNNSKDKNTDDWNKLNRVYQSIIYNLDTTYLGKGMDVFNDTVKNRPMAYGLILSAEVNRYRYTKNHAAIVNARKCGQWLVDNSDLNNNGIHGFGLADAWDAFNDQTINPIHQEYTITTAIAVKGLLDWYEIEQDTFNKSLIRESVYKILKPYIDSTYDSPIGIPAYSLSENDRKYDVFNPVSYLVGQLQRYSTIATNDSLQRVFEQRSNDIINVIISKSQTDEYGGIYWDYAEQIKQPNDLVHACYVIEGIRDYQTYGGNTNIKIENLIKHLDLFYSKGQWYEYPNSKQQTEEMNSRLWALGMLLYTLSIDNNHQKAQETLIPQIMKYQMKNGRFKLKINDDRVLIRQDAHLLYGLSYYLYHNITPE